MNSIIQTNIFTYRIRYELHQWPAQNVANTTIATKERPELAAFVQALEGGEGGAGVAAGLVLFTSATAGRGGSTTFPASRGGSGASAGGSNSSGTVLCNSPGLAGKIVGTLLGSLHWLPAYWRKSINYFTFYVNKSSSDRLRLCLDTR